MRCEEEGSWKEAEEKGREEGRVGEQGGREEERAEEQSGALCGMYGSCGIEPWWAPQENGAWMQGGR